MAPFETPQKSVNIKKIKLFFFLRPEFRTKRDNVESDVDISTGNAFPAELKTIASRITECYQIFCSSSF